jgi:deglycase
MSEDRLEGRRVVLVVAHQGFRDEELAVPRTHLEAAGVEVSVASSSLAPSTGMRGGQAFPDLLYCAVRLEDLDGLVFVGGTGAVEFFNDLTALRLARHAVDQGKVLGAICYAGSILANAGVLEGRRGTAYPTREAHLRSQGVVWTGEPVTIDGRIVTARDPQASEAFADALRLLLAQDEFAQ